MKILHGRTSSCTSALERSSKILVMCSRLMVTYYSDVEITSLLLELEENLTWYTMASCNQCWPTTATANLKNMTLLCIPFLLIILSCILYSLHASYFFPFACVISVLVQPEVSPIYFIRYSLNGG